MNALAHRLHPAPPLPSTQHSSSLGSTGHCGSLFSALAVPHPQPRAQAHTETSQAQAQTTPHVHAHPPSARDLPRTVLSPLSPTGLPGDTLDPSSSRHCINPSDDPPPASPSVSLSSPSMPSATPARMCCSRSQSASKTTMPPPPPPPQHPVALPIPCSSSDPGPSLLSTSPACTSPILSPVLPCLSSSSPSALSPQFPCYSDAQVQVQPPTHSGLLSPPPSLPPGACVPESPLAHARRAPPPAKTPPMRLHSSQALHTLAVRLPDGLAPEMVTVSAKKGARLAVVADLWHREDDSHYEWEVVFSPTDADMLSVRAVFGADGLLLIHVRRRPGGEGAPLPLICAH